MSQKTPSLDRVLDLLHQALDAEKVTSWGMAATITPYLIPLKLDIQIRTSDVLDMSRAQAVEAFHNILKTIRDSHSNKDCLLVKLDSGHWLVLALTCHSRDRGYSILRDLVTNTLKIKEKKIYPI